MKKLTLGHALLVLYAIFIIIFTFKTGFDLAYGLSWGAAPLWWVFQNAQSVITFFTHSIGYTGANLLAVIIIGAILYYGGNFLQQSIRKS